MNWAGFATIWLQMGAKEIPKLRRMKEVTYLRHSHSKQSSR
jgi:hypothetical protein